MLNYVGLCAVGAEKILGNELKLLGCKLNGNAPGRVFFSGDEDALYQANFWLRTCDRVYIQLAKYSASNFTDLFDGCYSAPWQDYLKKDVRVVVDKVRVYKSKLNSEHSIQGMIQKAIYQKLGDTWHITTLPETGERCDIRVYIDQDQAMILLDTSGDALHKRGYRTEGGIAPLRETTAAVLLQEMLWKRKMPLHDPFCGSGTIAIEATLYARNIAPGLGRHFAYEHLAIYNQNRAVELKKEAASKIRPDVECRITGSDIDPDAIERARLNAEHACVTAGRALQMIGSDAKILRPDFMTSDFRELRAPYPEGMLISNPPYGERLGDEKAAQELYQDMGNLFNDFAGWQMGFITNQEIFQDSIGRRADKIKAIKAGNLDTVFYMYNGNK